MKPQLETVLADLGQVLNSANLLWAVGASVMLAQYGIITTPTDIDIIVHNTDVNKANKLLSQFAIAKAEKESSIYDTEYFSEYTIKGIDVDVMAGLKIKLPMGKLYEYIFDANSIQQRVSIAGIAIPFASLEDWYVLYQLMPNREQKVKLIEEYFKEKGIKQHHLLQRMLQAKNTPNEVIERTEQLIKSCGLLV